MRTQECAPLKDKEHHRDKVAAEELFNAGLVSISCFIHRQSAECAFSGSATPFTLYSAANRSSVEAQRSRYVLSQVVFDRECGRLMPSFKSPLCL